MITRRRALQLAGLGGAIAAARPLRLSAAGLDEVKIGSPLVISDAPIIIAEAKGYCREQGIKSTSTNMITGSQMVAPLGTGQIDVAAAATSAGLFNADARGVGLKIVADKGSNMPGYAYVSLLIRKELADSGKFKTSKDLKGLRIAEPGKGGSTGATVNAALVKGGLTYNDCVHVYNMSFPAMLAAMKNGAIDAAPVPEPFNTYGQEQGIGVRYSADNFYPHQTVAVILYGGHFMKERKEVAQRFMKAYLKGVRFYNGALKDGHFAGPNAAEVIDILTKATRYKDPALYKKVVPNGCDPNGHVYRPSLEQDLAFWRKYKFVANDKIGVSDVLDDSWVDGALKVLGPYKPA